ncbi:interferon Regulatory Factor [Elysia marginata]|uniref:Interferon Regulatory Factor n=1 Tax=Elysia marginata TaxID=1093978 RepID=A0AAV4IDS5_9GAST|nr:interferon Regulatory Factor [Elysia marginata]
MSKVGKGLHLHQQKRKKTLVLFFKHHLEAETISGLSWLDKDKQIWQLPWKIHRPTIWGEPDALVLHSWAVYKYNYKEEEPSTKELRKWKENLRNSILTCPLIKEIEHCHEQKVLQPFKVYQFIEQKSRKTEANKTQNCRNDFESNRPYQNEDSSGTENSNLPNFNVLTPALDLPQNSYAMKSTSPPTSPLQEDLSALNPNFYLDYIQLEDCLRENSKENTFLPNQGEVCCPQVNDVQIQHKPQVACSLIQICNRQPGGKEISPNTFRSRSPVERWEDNFFHIPSELCDKNGVQRCSRAFADMNLDLSKDVLSEGIGNTDVQNMSDIPDALPLLISVSYASNQVMHRLMHEKFKLCYVESDEMRDSILQCPTPAQFGPSDAFLVELPHSNSIKYLNSKHAEGVSSVLKHMKRGITLSYTQGDIFATRYCKAVAYYYRTKGGEQVKLERDKTVKIFDFQKEFKTQFKEALWSHLTSDVKINFGVKSSPVEVVTLTITHREAKRMLQQRKNDELQICTEADCSLSNEFDTRLSIEQKLMGAQF